MKSRALLLTLVLTLSTGCFVRQKEFQALETETHEKGVILTRVAKENETLRQDLEALRQRLDNALKANADSGSSQSAISDQLAQARGKNDELAHQVEELQKELSQSRTEVNARLDELKRGQTPAGPPPVSIPQDKKAHAAVVKDAWDRKDWNALRQLGPEYAVRYATDDFADDALYYVGDGELKDNRPGSALGWFNRVLRGYAKSNLLGPTLLGMGDGYLALHDCENGKLAFSAAESRFPKDAVGKEAKAKLIKIAQNPPGLCAK